MNVVSVSVVSDDPAQNLARLKEVEPLAQAAASGGWTGTILGTRVLPVGGIRRWLSAVLVLAGAKLLWEATVLLLHR